MGESRIIAELAGAYAQVASSRATWLVAARGAAEALAKTALIGMHDRLVIWCPRSEARVSALFPWSDVVAADELAPESYLAAHRAVSASEAERMSLAHSGAPASYAYTSDGYTGRLFWLVPALSVDACAVADLRAFAQAAQTAGACLIVDNSVPTPFGCRPLMLGAQICLEACSGFVGEGLIGEVVAVSVARSHARRGRRERVAPGDDRSETAYRSLVLSLGAPGDPARSLRPLEVDLRHISGSLGELAHRMQPRFDAAQAIASYLSCHSSVSQVHYPGLANHPSRSLAQTTLEHGSGPVVTFSLQPGGAPHAVERSRAFLAAWARFYRDVADGEDACPRSTVALINPVSPADPCLIKLVMGAEDALSIVDALERAISSISA